MAAQPFRLLDLPLELQRLVLQKYFEDEWTITTKATYRRQKPSLTLTRTALPLSILRVCKRLEPEARHAMHFSTAVCHEGYVAHLLDNFRTASIWTFRITCLKLSSSDMYHLRYVQDYQYDWEPHGNRHQYRDVLPELKSTFPRLESISMIGQGQMQREEGPVNDAMDLNIGLHGLLIGSKDDELEKLADDHFYMVFQISQRNYPDGENDSDSDSESESDNDIVDSFSEEDEDSESGDRSDGRPGQLYAGISTTWSLAAESVFYKCDEERDHPGLRMIKGMQLFLKFQTDNHGTKIVRRWFAAAEDGPEGPSMESVLAILEEDVFNSSLGMKGNEDLRTDPHRNVDVLDITTPNSTITEDEEDIASSVETDDSNIYSESVPETSKRHERSSTDNFEFADELICDKDDALNRVDAQMAPAYDYTQSRMNDQD